MVGAAPPPVSTPTPPSPTPVGTVAPVSPTPTVVTSEDLAGQFSNDSSTLTQKTTPLPTPTPVDNTDSNSRPTDNASPSNENSDPNADTTDNGDVSTGDPLYDSLQKWQDEQDQKAQQDADDQKAQVEASLQTNLASNDAQFAQVMQGIKDSYGQLIDAQTRLNSASNARSAAYGAATGNAVAAPLSFTGAVSDTEQAGIDKITTLDQKRDDAITKAQQAQSSGDAKLLNDSMTEVDKIETDMKSTASTIQSQVTSRLTMIKNAQTQAAAQQKVQAGAAAAQASVQYGDQYANAPDNATKDSIIKNIVNQSGGLLDYGTVYTALEKYNASAQKETAAAAAANTKKITDAIDQMRLQNLQNPKPKPLTQAEQKTASISDIQSGLTPGTTIPGSQGIPVLDDSGNITPEAWEYMLKNAPTQGLTRADLVKNFGSYLVNAGGTVSSKFGLTPTEIRSITGSLTSTSQ
jgi:hypothetical protein